MFDFRPLSEREKVEAKIETQRIKEATEIAQQKLKACLLSDTFSEYKEALDNCHNELIAVGIGIKNNTRNTTDRLALYDMLFSRAEVLGILLEKVNNARE